LCAAIYILNLLVVSRGLAVQFVGMLHKRRSLRVDIIFGRAPRYTRHH